MFFKSTKIIGLDIGSSAIKVAELDVKGKSATLMSFGVNRTPAQSIVGGEINDPISLSGAVMALVSQLGTKRKNVATGMWGSAVIIKKISLPRMDTSLIGEQIRWEAEQYIPFDLSEINLEFHVIKRPQQNPDAMEVLLIAAKKDVVFKYAETVESSRLQCSILDVNSFALANCFSFNYNLGPGSLVGVIDIGSTITNFVVLDESEVIFCRDIPVGGSNYTTEIQNQMGVSFEEAETHKISISTGQAAPPQVADIITATHESVCDELRRTYDFYLATGAEAQIQKLYVTGGAASTPGLSAKISEIMGIPVESLNPFQRIAFDGSRFTPDYISNIAPFCAAVVGLALRKVGDR